jgi:hypothetical protein
MRITNTNGYYPIDSPIVTNYRVEMTRARRQRKLQPAY